MKRCFGSKEMEVISRLAYEKITIITKKQFDEMFGAKLVTRHILYQLKKKGILKSINRGIYYYSPIESGPNGIRINEFLIPSLLFPKRNYYLGFGTMYNYYGFTDQIFQTFYVLNTSIQKDRSIDSRKFKLLRIKKNRLYGLTKIKVQDSEVIVSNRERTLIDLIYFPDPVGGLKKAFEIFKLQIKDKKIDVKKLIKYTILFPNVSTRKRIGFLLEKCGIADAELKPLLKNIENASLTTLYGSKSRKGSINNKWKVIIDDTQ
ncbi:type IV toxin-antitoxin system AbiEi family antitoxin [bacterium]